MTLRDLLSERLKRYNAELSALQNRIWEIDNLIDHVGALLEAEDTPDGQLQLVTLFAEDEGKSNDDPSDDKHVEVDRTGRGSAFKPKGAMSVRQALDSMLKKGPRARPDIVKRMPVEYPVDVKDITRSVTAALGAGVKDGRYVRVKRGVYRYKT